MDEKLEEIINQA